MRLGFAIASVPLAVLIGFSLPATAEPDTHPLEISTDKTVSVINGASSAPMIAASRSSIASKPLVAPRSSIATTSATSDLNLDVTKGGSSAKPEASKLVKTKARKKAPRSARLVASVNLSSQRMTVTVDGDVKHVWKVSSGGRGYHTPTGSFTPYRMHTMWRSRKYNNAKMPYSVFYRGGYAVHATYATSRLGRPASHGCVRLSVSNARKFFNLVKKYRRANTRVVISGRTPSSRRSYASRQRSRSRSRRNRARATASYSKPRRSRRRNVRRYRAAPKQKSFLQALLD